MKVTIKDIAERCQTSSATVSRVLSGSDYPVSEQLRNRIVSTAYEMNYRPNIYGRLLRGTSSREVGVIVPGIANPYYGELLESVEKACYEFGLRPSIRSSYQSPELEQQLIDDCLENQVCGILISSIRDSRDPALLRSGASVPMVYFDQCLGPTADKRLSITYDFRRAGYLAAAHLLQTGHRRIAYVTPSYDRPSRKLIGRGIREAHIAILGSSDNFMAITLQAEQASDMDLAYSHIRDIASLLVVDILTHINELDSLIVLNDLLAIALMKELARNGVAIPDDLSMVSHDDIWLADVVNPGLTTVRQAANDTGRAAVCLLNRELAKTEAYETIVISPELVIRDSVKYRL